jgi:hypothetical protein
MSSKLRIVVTGFVAQYPLGGVAWDYLQYLDGLARLGHDVYYLEDTGQWPYNPSTGGTSGECGFNVRHLAEAMEEFGLPDRWAYWFPGSAQWFGLPDARRREVLATADLLLNVSGSLWRFPRELGPARLAYLDTDPAFTQVKLARGQMDFQRLVDAHHIHFTFGERLGPPVPDTGHRWRPTRQPVVISRWNPNEAVRPVYTTVMNWTSYKPLVHEGRTYGQKDDEFRRFLDLPRQVAPVTLEVALAHGKTRGAPRGLLARHGWKVVDPLDCCADLGAYRAYVQSSRAEWSVAKNGYVQGRTGWFSCRSACYLAAGRPVVVQDTGFSDLLPTGDGVLVFDTLAEAADAIHRVEADYAHHARAARRFAQDHFDSARVLDRLLEESLAG